MADNRMVLRDRFARLQRASATRRADFKGYRMRMNLRIALSTSIDLQIIKLLTGEAKNSFCERVLADAVKLSINELKGAHGEEAWAAIEKCAQRRKSEPSR